MCGIFTLFDSDNGSSETFFEIAQAYSGRMSHRGPDDSGVYMGQGWVFAHERLSIVDLNGGHQPLKYSAPNEQSLVLVANGEIYNHLELRQLLKTNPTWVSNSDSEIIIHLYREKGPHCLEFLDGMFAFVLVREDGQQMLAARDPIGIKPLYFGRTETGQVALASELKALVDLCITVEEFPPGHYYTPESGFVRYYRPSWDRTDYHPTHYSSATEIRELLEYSVVKRLMGDVEIGLLLSGGLDSAIVAALQCKHQKHVKSFTVGMANSPDVLAARAVASFLGTEHYERIFTPDEAFAIIPQIIYHLETYETELIRSAIPNYFLAQLASSHVKVVLTGEGSDELFAGYHYFQDAPDADALQTECRRIFHHLKKVNLQRVDRMTMAHGLEARVPFLDCQFVEAAFSIDPREKLITADRCEKWYLRNLFQADVPETVLWRSKAMQCEGVGMNWVAKLQEHCAAVVTDRDFAKAQEQYPINPPPKLRRNTTIVQFLNIITPVCLNSFTFGKAGAEPVELPGRAQLTRGKV